MKRVDGGGAGRQSSRGEPEGAGNRFLAKNIMASNRRVVHLGAGEVDVYGLGLALPTSS
jgi:hypothetical protein